MKGLMVRTVDSDVPLCVGKVRIAKILTERDDLREGVKIFYNPLSTPQEIATIGEKLILALYNAPRTSTALNLYRLAF